MKKRVFIIIGIVVVIIIAARILRYVTTSNLFSLKNNSSRTNPGTTTSDTTRPPLSTEKPVTLLPNNEGQVMCTMEAKLCPDGSYVGRGGPKCEFNACPTKSTTLQGKSARLNQKILQNGIYITPLLVTEDSRCPTGAMCVWAGTVRVKTKLEVGTNSEELILGLDDSTGFATKFMNKEISLIKVTPDPEAGKTTKNYAFTFSVK